MAWLFESQEITQLPQDCAGFVYVITNKLSGRQYIGKKLAKFRKTTYRMVKLKNGKKKRKKIRPNIFLKNKKNSKKRKYPFQTKKI